MPTSFNCPMCAAPLDLSSGAATTMRCHYCGNTIIIPEEARSIATASDDASARAGGSFAPLIDQALKMAEVARLFRAGNKIAAIKLYRETFGGGLKEAKDAVEQIGTGEPISFNRTEIEIDKATSMAQPLKTVGLMHEQAIHQQKGKAARWILIGIALVILLAGLFVVFGAVAAYLAMRPAQTNGPVSRPAQSPAEGFAIRALEFGSEGIGAGQFKDARSIAVDGEGRIYVGEYTGGRVQVFDAQGKFLTQWMVDPKRALLALAADRKGTVYVAHPGSILRYEGATGRLLGEVTKRNAARTEYYSEVVAALDGSLYAIGSNYNIVRIDPEGGIRQTINVAERIGEDVHLDRLAVDGTGNIFAVSRSEKSVFKFAPDGRFVNRFGGAGRGHGQFDSPWGIVTDGQGRVYVSDLGHPIQVFDSNGRYLDSFGAAEVVFGIAINDQNEIFASERNRHRIVKYVLNKR
jgi:ribosomal protein L7/L12